MWREGEWLDLWSVVHFLSGMSVGFVLYTFKFAAPAAAIVAFLAFFAYEMWEALVKISETPTNRVMDVVVGMVSFWLAFFFLAPWFEGGDFFLMFGLLVSVNIILAALGWRASQKAALLEKNLRGKYANERTLLLKRGARLRSKFKRTEHST